MSRRILSTSLITSAVIGAVALVSQSAEAKEDGKPEKCYGIVKAGQNDCGVPGAHSCKGQSKKDNDPKEWMYVKTGNCDRIVGGSKTPK